MCPDYIHPTTKTHGLHDALATTGHARVVSVSSQAHSLSPVDFDDIHFNHRPYDPIAAYCQSKTANSLFAIAAAKRYAPDICVNAVTPGAIRTNLQHHTGGFTVELPRELIVILSETKDLRGAGVRDYCATPRRNHRTLFRKLQPSNTHRRTTRRHDRRSPFCD